MSKQRNRAKVLALLVLALIIGFFMLRRFEHSQVYFPSQTLMATGAELGRPFEDVSFAAKDGCELHGWFFPAATNSPRARMTVLFCHGNAGNISHRLETCEALLATGANVFVFDYRGYGRSSGKPGEEGTILDAQAAYQWLLRKGFSAHQMIGFGESLGGGVVSELALRDPLAGIILQSTFTSIPDIGAELFRWLPVRWLASIRYDTHAKLPRIKIPVLVMHSRTDDLIGFHHGEKNFAAANEPKLFWEIKGGHNDPISDQKLFVGGLEKFLQLIETSSPTDQTRLVTGGAP